MASSIFNPRTLQSFSTISLQVFFGSVSRICSQGNVQILHYKYGLQNFSPSVSKSLLVPSVLSLLIGCQEVHPALKNWVMMCWCGYLSGARGKWFAYGPADATATPSSPASVKSRMVLPFSYQLTQGVLEIKSLNGCSFRESTKDEWDSSTTTSDCKPINLLGLCFESQFYRN